jgi:hypothetical protein
VVLRQVLEMAPVGVDYHHVAHITQVRRLTGKDDPRPNHPCRQDTARTMDASGGLAGVARSVC